MDIKIGHEIVDSIDLSLFKLILLLIVWLIVFICFAGYDEHI
jgi:hypothetical protein